MTTLRAWVVWCFVAASALCSACEDAETAALIEVESDLGDALTRVEVQIRDVVDGSALDEFTFDSDRQPVPFSFRVEPRERTNQMFVVKATGYERSEFLSEAKLRIRLVEGTTSHNVVRLLAACGGVRCSDGESCEPHMRSCAGIPTGSATSSPGHSSGEAGDDSMEPGGAEAGSKSTGSGNDPIEAEALAGSSGNSAAGSGGEPGAQEPADPSAGSSAPSAGASGTIAPDADGGSGQGGSAVAADGGAGGGGASAAGSGEAGRGGSGGGGAGSGGAGNGGAGGGGAGRGGGGTGAVNGGGAGSGVLSAETDAAEVTRDGRGYIVQNNVYSPGASQTLRYEGTSFTITSVTGSDPAGISFPAAYVGTVYRRASPGTNLPMRADEVASIDARFSSNAGSVDGAYHMAHVLWFSQSPEGDGSLPTGGFLEVWYYVQGGHDPTGRLIASAITLDGAPGAYDLWQGSCFERPCTTYVSTQAVTSVEGEITPFLRDALARPDGVSGSWYLASVFAGFEIHSGGVGLEATDISIEVR